MAKSSQLPREYRIPVLQDYVRSIKPPHCEDLIAIHAFVRIRDLGNGTIPDKINPRSHEVIKINTRVPKAIKESLEEESMFFHLLNRGCLILAKKAWYNNQSKTLHFIIESDDQHGMVDGATTDRVLALMKKEAAMADFSTLEEEEMPDFFQDSYIYLEIIAGDIENGLRLKLAEARNTSMQVKEFSLEDLGHGFDWLKKVLERSELMGRVRYRENEPKPVDVRTVLALLTLFHPQWEIHDKDPMVAYTGKGRVIDLYRKDDWRESYEKLAPVTVDILKLYDYLHINFQRQYMKAYGRGSKLGRRKEVRYIDPKRAKILPLTRQTTQYVLPDGWLYPLLASFRILLDWPKSARNKVKWQADPFKFFDKHGPELVMDIVEQSQELGNNPNAAGKSRMLWSGLKTKVENRLLKSK